MKKQILAAAAVSLWAVGSQAQVTSTTRPSSVPASGTVQPQTAPAPTTSAPLPFTTAPLPSTTAPVPSVSGQVPATTSPTPGSAFNTIQPPVVNNAPSITDTVGAQTRPNAIGQDSVVGPRNGVQPNTAIGAPEATAPSGIGATNVTSELNTTGVKMPPRVNEQPLDRALRAKIRAQLSASRPEAPRGSVMVSPEVVRDLRITSQNGKVILEGKVENAQQRAMIEQKARQVHGVGMIENRLVIRNSQSVGAPAAGQSGQATNGFSPVITGQTPRNASDLDDRQPELTPDK